MEDGGMLIAGLLLAGVAIVIMAVWQSNNAIKAQPKKELYENLLSELSKEPNNSELKTKVLEAGRDYYATLRTDHCLTIYDEQAITNDINSACINITTTQVVNNDSDVYEDIKKLSELRDGGILTEEEYNEKKKILLEKIG